MSANLYQGHGGHVRVIDGKSSIKFGGPVQALKQGSVGNVMSDLQKMQQEERKQHEDLYLYEHGHNDGSAPLGKPSF